MSKKITMNRGNDKKIEEVFKEFINYSKAKNLADRTIGYYKNNYERFKFFLDNKEIKLINNVDADTVQQFILKLQSEIENPKSINTILRAIRTFLNYAMKLNC